MPEHYAEEKEQVAQLILEGSPDCIKILDKEGRIQFMNKQGLGLLEIKDFSPYQFAFWWELWPQKSQSYLKAQFKRACGGEVIRFQEYCPTVNGTPKWWDVVLQPLRNPDGSVKKVIATSRDITLFRQEILEQSRFAANEKLQESYQLFSTVIASTQDLVWAKDLEGRITICNQATIDLMGNGDKDKVLGKGAEIFTDPSMARTIREADEKVISTGLPLIVEEEFHHKGKKLVFQTIKSPLFNASREIVGIVGVSRNVTEQKQVEEELRQNENRLRLALEAAFLISFEWDIEKNEVRRFHSTDSTLGKTEQGHSTFEEVASVVLEDDRELFRANVLAALKHPDGKYENEFRILRTDGSVSWLYERGKVEKDAQGKPLRLIGLSQDITERKKVAELSRKAEEHFRQLADMIPQIIWTSRPDGHLDYYNKRWYEFTGATEGFGDQSWIPVLHPDDVQFCLDTWYHSVQTGEPYQIEYRFKAAATGEYRWFLGKALPIKNSKGEVTKWFGTCTDIHDQKMMRVHLEQLVRERTKELERSNEDLQQFAHVASHDLKEPVRKVLIFGSRLRNEFGRELSDKAIGYVSKMEKAAQRMYAMIDGVLAYSSFNATLHKSDLVDLNLVVRDIENDLEVYIQEKHAKINYPQLPVVPGSPILIHQLFYNIINNSLKFCREGVDPVIDISCFDVDSHFIGLWKLRPGVKYVRILIQDNGIGFSNEQAAKIFETFTRLHAKDKYEGTGLGLALCKKIVERHGGIITASGKEGEGAKFEIVLPVQ
jgi:hypothetical protein